MTRRTRKQIDLNTKYEYDRGYFQINVANDVYWSGNTKKDDVKQIQIIFFADDKKTCVDIFNRKASQYKDVLKEIDEHTGQLVKFDI